MKHLIASLLLLAVIFTGCSKSDPPPPAIQLGFQTSAQGLGDADDITLKVVTSRAVESDLTFDVEVTPADVTYEEHFTTNPGVVEGKISLTIPAGATEASFVVNKNPEAFFSGEEYIEFSVKTISSEVVAGANPLLKLSFGALVSTGTSMRLDGGPGGASAVNSVYVDFSNNQQTSVLRSSWALGFFNGAGYNVIVNGTKPITAYATNLTNISAITIADIDLDTLAIGHGKGSFAIIDHYSHDFDKTVIAPVSATASENKIYIVADAGAVAATPTADQLWKVKIDRSVNGYTVQYAKINETTINTIEIAKDASYNYQFLSLADKKLVNVEPKKDKWDFQWSYSMYYTGPMPYAFSDLVFLNTKADVQAAQIDTTVISYNNYSASDVANTVFSSDRDAIGSKWRNTTGEHVGVNRTVFYVIKDPAGNVYKLRFDSFHSTAADGGERGYPNITYELVKQAD